VDFVASLHSKRLPVVMVLGPARSNERKDQEWADFESHIFLGLNTFVFTRKSTLVGTGRLAEAFNQTATYSVGKSCIEAVLGIARD